MTFVVLILWNLIGLIYVTWTWTRVLDLTIIDLLFAFCASSLGPINVIIYLVFIKRDDDIIEAHVLNYIRRHPEDYFITNPTNGTVLIRSRIWSKT